jgi:hypothetical protein
VANTFKNDTFRSGKLLGNILIAIFSILVLLAFLNIIVSAWMILSPDTTIELDTGEIVDVAWIFVGLVAILEIAIRVVCAVVFLVWLHRVFGNLPVIGARNLEFSPGWAVGWWFIPFLNFVRPYQVVRELYSESHRAVENTGGEPSEPTTENVGFWWGTFLISGFVLRISDGMVGGANEAPSKYFPVAHLAGNILFSSAAILAIVVVRNVNRWQEKAFAFQRPTESFMPPPPPTFDQNDQQ